MVWAADVLPRSMLAKLRVVGVASTSATPRPVRVAVRVGLAELVEATVIVPVRAPRAVGEKMTAMVQLVSAAMAPVQVVVETAKSPVVVSLEMVSGIELVFLQVNICAAEVLPTIVFG